MALIPPSRPRAQRRRPLLLLPALLLPLLAATLVLVGPAPPAAALSSAADTALNRAVLALRNEDCRQLIEEDRTKSLFGESAVDIVARMRKDKRYKEMNNVVDPENAAARTSSVGSGSSSTTTFFQAFYDGRFEPFDYVPVPVPLLPDDVRLVVVLHELSHKTGTLPRDDLPGGRDLARARNGVIVQRCLAPLHLRGDAGFPYFPVEILAFTCAVQDPDFILAPDTISRYVCDLFWTGGDPDLVRPTIGYAPLSVDGELRQARAVIDCPSPFDFPLQPVTFTFDVFAGLMDMGSGSADPDYTYRWITTSTPVLCKFPPSIFGPIW